MIGSDRQSYRVISYYDTEDAKAGSSLINQRGSSVPRITAYKALPRPSKDETFSTLDLYPKEPDPSTTSSDWQNKRKRKTVVIPQIDRRYPEYEPQMSDYPIMFPYRKVEGATEDVLAQAGPSLRIEKSMDRKRVSNEQYSLSSSHQARASAAFAPQPPSRPIMVEQYMNPPAPPLIGYTPFTSSNTYYHQGNAPYHSLQPVQYHAFQGMAGGFVTQQQQQYQQQQQQQYTLGPSFFQPSSYGPRPPFSSSGQYPFPPPPHGDNSRNRQ
ncbi:hypothetical protein BJ741DRAFT_620707 [Chytriomyces cf. hyalinus JEL632]|nr:hypothetical protein BJ741DRAFT_620707 [Chytriomyces cf. hyalinus JEL632]